MRVRIAALCVGLITSSVWAEDPKPPKRVLPGRTSDGFVQLPNQWKLAPAGRQIEVGDLPVNIQFHPTGQFAAVLHSGYREHEVVILDLNPAGRKVLSRVVVPQSFYGLAFSPDGKQVYASGGEFDVVHVWDFDKGYLHNARKLPVENGKHRTVPGGVAEEEARNDLFALAQWGNGVDRRPLDNPENRTDIPNGGEAPKQEKPQGDPPSPPDGRREIDATVAE